jgi:hypothetical protein
MIVVKTIKQQTNKQQMEFHLRDEIVVTQINSFRNYIGSQLGVQQIDIHTVESQFHHRHITAKEKTTTINNKQQTNN